MAAMSPVPADHPLMLAWSRYKATPDFANTRRWALHEEHVEGSLWAAFMGGFTAASIMPHPNPPGGPVANPAGERLYSAYVEQSRSEIPEEDRAAPSLEDAVRFIERWMPESLPASDTGQIPFGRALLEMALDAMRAATAKAPADAPEPRSPPMTDSTERGIREQKRLCDWTGPDPEECETCGAIWIIGNPEPKCPRARAAGITVNTVGNEP